MMFLLKPFVSNHGNDRLILTIFLPAVGGTVLLLWHFRRHITDSTLQATEYLFALDTLRWFSTLGILLVEGGWPCFVPIGLMMPTIFAIVAWRQVARLKRA
jgi:hypothetical protein